MANKKITELPLVTSSSASDDIPIVQSGVTSRIKAGAGGGLDADKVDNIQGTALWYSSSGTGGSDGNAGQPPAPKISGVDPAFAAPGKWCSYDIPSGSGLTFGGSTGQLFWICTSYGVTSGGVGQGIANCNATLGAFNGNARVHAWRQV